MKIRILLAILSLLEVVVNFIFKIMPASEAETPKIEDNVSPIITFSELSIGDFFIYRGGYEVLYKYGHTTATKVSSGKAEWVNVHINEPVERYIIHPANYSHMVNSYTANVGHSA